jgi:formylmethanofuran dehydrogenase subunit E
MPDQSEVNLVGACAECGEGINFKREIVRDGRTLCRSCGGERYYSEA